MLFIAGSLQSLGQATTDKSKNGKTYKPEAKIEHVYARDGESLVIQYGTEQIVRLGPGAYDRDKEIVVYPLQIGKGCLINQLEEKHYFVGVLVETGIQCFLPMDKGQSGEKQYKYFLTVSDNLRHLVLKIYVNAATWQYYSIQKQPSGTGFSLIRKVDPATSNFFQEWKPEGPEGLSTHADYEDIYFEMAVADGELYGCNGRTYLPFIDLSKYLYMESTNHAQNPGPLRKE